MREKKVYQCEGSIDGIFTAIYDAWDSRYGHDNIRIEVMDEGRTDLNFEFFTEYIKVNTDMEKVEKVARSIKKKISPEAYDMIFYGACSGSYDRGDIIYRFLIEGFRIGKQIVECLSNDVVMNLFNLNRSVGNERHHYLGFLRFVQTKSNILYAKINPKNDVIRLLAPHFADRIGNEDFIIYDETRRTAIIHRTGYPWVYTVIKDMDVEQLLMEERLEDDYEELWRTFFTSIAIKERSNPNLQRNNLPKRFRGNMTEFTK